MTPETAVQLSRRIAELWARNERLDLECLQLRKQLAEAQKALLAMGRVLGPCNNPQHQKLRFPTCARCQWAARQEEHQAAFVAAREAKKENI